VSLDERLLDARADYHALVGPRRVDPPDTTDHRGLRRHRHRRTIAIALAALGIVAGGVSLAPDDAGHDVRTRTGSTAPTGTTEPVDVGDVEPTAPEDPRVTLTPAGPYSDGQRVELSMPEDYGVDLANGGGYRQCVILDGRGGWPEEVCDPVLSPPGPSLVAGRITAVVHRTVLTPRGERDCEDVRVECRLVVRTSDDRVRATNRLRFTGAATAPPFRIDVETAERPGAVVVRPTGLAPDPTWFELRRTDPARAAAFAPFQLRICAFETSSTTPGPYGEYLWGIGDPDLPVANCTWQVDADEIDPDRPDEPITVEVPPLVDGYRGFSDCAVDACYVQLSRNVVGGITPDGALLGGDGDAAAALVPVDPRVPPPVPPSLRIATPPPYRVGQDLTLEVDGVDLDDLAIGWCDIGSPWSCGYTGHRPGSRPGEIVVTVPSNMMFCAPKRCYLEIDGHGEGMPPPATAALPGIVAA